MEPFSEETQYFFELTPERILSAVERSGLRCTGRCLQLNSMENRVYEVEVEVEDEATLSSPSARFRVVKFYRPGRWSEAQVLEEHQFLADLREMEIPVVAPIPFQDGRTLHTMQEIDIRFAVFPKQGGRIPDELSIEQAEIVGRLLARMHAVGKKRESSARLRLTPQVYGRANLQALLELRIVPADVESSYSQAVEEICGLLEPHFASLEMQRIHGDCHFGNILWSTDGPNLVDFDDMVVGPPVQDLWLIFPSRDEYSRRSWHALLEAYEEFATLDRKSLKLVEGLRALRFIHFNTWIARRWKDPAFQRVFSEFNSYKYWEEQTSDLVEQAKLLGDALAGNTP